ncbi:TonB-dependent receptor domain-containing protein [Psychrobium sp. 1_MG-2023]|uniref:TonB-dependent receptor family protein n=1 Tax=Psychrobium sp. 1_MG-2023 TaxID=3062624 RepID=UPI000C3205E5|nr:TonB-dependent receptor [Psychrobium sp. 1_MG-2023]MDP2561495.1 TonB-dependent receptor [Psychrobium sp. 1_MG-2023]PKF57761.1 TonB-dependent receptor [Alteromonadales bacterium alter-6D02]
MKKTVIASIVSALIVSPVMASDDDEKKVRVSQEKTANEKLVEKIRIIGHSDGLRTEGGSATFIDETELERFEYDDINRILANVPGVNIRQEDGYGLRPNIGFRGATPERSKKIALMEDGILIAPAPYSASAAYYFPMVSRITGVEVFKGPASIKYGPNTVAGALNLTTRPIPYDKAGGVDIAGGADGYQKLHGYYGATDNKFGYLFEAINVQADGFKNLDFGGETGFDKSSYMLKLNYDLSSKDLEQLVEFKAGYDEEVSHETYLGLTEEDFNADSNRRYAATQNDLMDWTHSNLVLTHFIQSKDFTVTTRAYRNDFERSWNKLNGFNDTSVKLDSIIAKPEQGLHPEYLEILKGQNDSEGNNQALVLGDNAREYFSHGIQTDLTHQLTFAGVEHKIEVGLRYHVDEIKRMHTTDVFDMRSGQLVKRTTDAPTETDFNSEKSTAVSVYFQDSVTLDDLTLTAGIRGEFIDARYQDSKDANDWLEKESRIWLPGISAFYKASNELGFLFGVNKGYVPTSPMQKPETKAEESINYEIGTRYNDGETKAEAIVFFNDFSNLKESCTFSASANCTVIDEEYNAGQVDIYGLEATASHTFALSDSIDMPINAVYTYSKSEFKENFVSDFPLWGTVEAGDEVPYLPEHQLTFTIGLSANRWQASLLTKYVGEMIETAGEGNDLSYVGSKTEALTVVDFSASHQIGDGDDGDIYFKVDNIFDTVEIISHRPYGARPSKPRQVMIGYKISF